MSWKLEIVKLREDATAVHAHAPTVVGLGAREIARVLSGVTSIVARKHGVEEMQRVCAELVLDRAAWQSRLAVLPRKTDGYIDPELEMIATVARGLLHCSSVEAVRSALAFWASERDPAVWQSVVGLAA